MKRRAWLGILLWLCAGATAEQPAGEAARETAAVLAASCHGCHAPGADATAGFPDLTQLSPKEIASTLRAYRSDEVGGTLMNRIAKGYTDAEIDELADQLGAPVR